MEEQIEIKVCVCLAVAIFRTFVHNVDIILNSFSMKMNRPYKMTPVHLSSPFLLSLLRDYAQKTGS